MKNGYDTLLAVFRAVTEEGASSRSEIAGMIGASQVSVSKAVRTLLDAEMISSNGSIATGGRLSECLCPAYGRKYLAVNLCEKPFSYALAHSGENLSPRGPASAEVRFVNYLGDLDFCENVIMLARRISREITDTPAAVALALPDSPYTKGARFVGNEFCDYLGDDLCAIFKSFGITADVTVDRRQALLASRELRRAKKPALYVSFSHRVYGVYCGDSLLDFDWSDVSIDGATVSDILKCYQGGERLTQRLTKFVKLSGEFFNAGSVLIDTNLVSEETVEEICASSGIIRDVTDSSPILSGLLSLLAEAEIKRLPSSHFSAQK